MKVTFEIYPSAGLDMKALPTTWPLTIAARSGDLRPTLELHRELRSRATPHVAAALLESSSHLEEVADELRDTVFLIRGDATPRGPFQRSAELIPPFEHCREIGVAGYPESHPSYPEPTFGDRILLEKQALGATYVVTQLSFDAVTIQRWVERIREQGVTLPVYCGVAAPLNPIKLLRIAKSIGVGDSVRFLSGLSRRDVLKMARRYDPRPLMESVAEHVDGFHVYTFNAIKTTAKWVEDTPWLAQLAQPEAVQRGAA